MRNAVQPGATLSRVSTTCEPPIDILADGLKRRLSVQQIIGALLKAARHRRQAPRRARSNTRWRPPGCRRPGSWPSSTSPPFNEPLIRDLAISGFLEAKRHRAGRRHRHRQDPSRHRHRGSCIRNRCRSRLRRAASRRRHAACRGRTCRPTRSAKFSLPGPIPGRTAESRKRGAWRV